MAGNESKVVQYLFDNIGKIKLNHIGTVESIGAPKKGQEGYIQITNESEMHLIATTDSKKKADVYINDFGVSVKQEGGSFGFNRLQRKSLDSVFSMLEFQNIPEKIRKFDEEVEKFHQSSDKKRNIDWSVFFNEQEFCDLTELLMTKYSPKYGFSQHPADLILIAAKAIKTTTDICVMDFPEYFKLKKDKLKIAIRRQWVGQDSTSEHKRAVSIAKVPENSSWVFNEVSGEPRNGWKSDFPESDRKTVYFIMIEEVKGRMGRKKKNR
ncbi:hypothetical protein [Bacillus benzoevorans]|uniref:Uncharacterized protein n=1 Tax=Bacillus benzoevorans TaxID=1456 RepID=A0A7X0LUF0_9BACI|nr:hypothetical protein [Bacillus benzoevorans]MBB6444478.1 hypothetical protein [Bacillus benzoevorans]